MLLKDNGNAGLNVGGDIADWKDVPAIDLGDGISVKTAVLGGKLLVAVEAKGQNLVADDVFTGVGLYIDPFEKTDEWSVPRRRIKIWRSLNSSGQRKMVLEHFVT